MDKTRANPELGSEFPAHYYGPGGQERLFHSRKEIPAGWEDHPSKVTAAQPAKSEEARLNQGKPDKSTGTKPQTGAGGNGTGIAPGTLTELDAHGHPWDANLHAASKTKTSAGLWRMKVGASRPAPAEGYPKPDKTDTVAGKAAKGEKKFDL